MLSDDHVIADAAHWSGPARRLRATGIFLPDVHRGADAVNPYVFIVGATRSGTTLLQRIVDAHPQIAIIHEAHWLPRFYEEGVGVDGNGLVTADIVPKLLEQPRFGKLKIGQRELERLLASGKPLRYSVFVTRILDLYGRRRGKHLVGEKTPSYVRNIATLHELWPEARFIHLVRDGRDACLSMMSWKGANRTVGRFSAWQRDPVLATAFWWKWHVSLGREAGSRLGCGRYHELRYEALVADPVAECQALCAFLEVPYEPIMLTYHEGRTRSDPGLDAKRAWLPITTGLRDWRSNMSPEAVERFEAAAGDLLEDLGYGRGCHHPSPESRRAAAQMRSALAAQLRARTGYPLPQRW
jgi:hypothetical protein